MELKSLISYVFSGAGSTLQFSSVLKTDTGDYVCFAENVAGLTTASLTLDVQCKYMYTFILLNLLV